MNIDLTKYLGNYGAAIAAMGLAILAWLYSRTTGNMDTKISNIESELLQTRQDLARLVDAFSEYRRNHP